MNRTEMKQLMTRLEDEKKLPLIELHVLVPSGPALLNRDINGRLKTIKVGGVSRARISSQAKTRPIRVAEYNDNAAHSRYLPQKVAQKLEAMGKDEKYIEGALKLVKDNGKGTAQILAFSDHDIDELAKFIVEKVKKASDFKDENNSTTKALVKEMINYAKERSVDNTTCLMGRMSTETRLLDTIESARHVSHLYSIDRWYGDSDTYNAVDDLKSYTKEPDFIKFLNEDVSDTGSAFLDANDIASNVFYGYTNISTRTLLENKLRGINADNKAAVDKAIEESKDIIKRYIIDYLTIMPTSKQTSCATFPLPLVAFLTAGTRVVPMTADSVFEKIVKATESKSVGDIGAERLKVFAESLTNGAFAVNEYQKMIWISDFYKDMIPTGCVNASVNTALDEVLDIIGE